MLKINKEILLSFSVFSCLIGLTVFGYFYQLGPVRAEGFVPNGWCVFHRPITPGGGSNYGDEMLQTSCQNKPDWALFCPHVFKIGDSPIYRNQDNCNCSNELSREINPAVPPLLSGEMRYQLTESAGWWDFFMTEAGRLYLAGAHANGCRTNCGGSCSLNNKDKLTRITKYGYGDSEIFKWGFAMTNSEVEVSFGLAQEICKQNDNYLQLDYPNCNFIRLPAGCSVSDDFRLPSDSTCQGESPSQHCYGNAIDISCGEPNNGGNKCGADTQKALDIIRKYWRKEIIRECSVDEIRKYRLSTTSPSVVVPKSYSQIIHIDLREPSIRTQQGI